MRHLLPAVGRGERTGRRQARCVQCYACVCVLGIWGGLGFSAPRSVSDHWGSGCPCHGATLHTPLPSSRDPLPPSRALQSLPPSCFGHALVGVQRRTFRSVPLATLSLSDLGAKQGWRGAGVRPAAPSCEEPGGDPGKQPRAPLSKAGPCHTHPRARPARAAGKLSALPPACTRVPRGQGHTHVGQPPSRARPLC